MVVFVGLFVVLAEHPMIMVGGMVVYAVIIGVVGFFGFGTFWYSYLMLLVVLSGVLVVFTYMASLSPNEGFFLDYVGFGVGVFLMSGGWMCWFYDDVGLVALRFFDSVDGVMSLFMLVMLFFSMLVVVWFSSFWEGPLRCLNCA